jgi:hypothetical protein
MLIFMQRCLYKWQVDNDVKIIALVTVHLYFAAEIKGKTAQFRKWRQRSKILSLSLSLSRAQWSATAETRARGRPALLVAGGLVVKLTANHSSPPPARLRRPCPSAPSTASCRACRPARHRARTWSRGGPAREKPGRAGEQSARPPLSPAGSSARRSSLGTAVQRRGPRGRGRRFGVFLRR